MSSKTKLPNFVRSHFIYRLSLLDKNILKPSPPNKNNEFTSDQASELSTLDTHTDKFHSTMETNNLSLKSEILNKFRKELNDTLARNNNALSLKISNDLEQKFIKLLQK